MEDAAAAYTGPAKKTNAAYSRLQISRYFKRWMYEHAATAGLKMAGLLNENIQDLAARLDNSSPTTGTGNPAGGGTTTGATQGNAQIRAQLQALKDAYAGAGPWAYGTGSNPFEAANWGAELALPPAP